MHLAPFSVLFVLPAIIGYSHAALSTSAPGVGETDKGKRGKKAGSNKSSPPIPILNTASSCSSEARRRQLRLRGNAKPVVPVRSEGVDEASDVKEKFATTLGPHQLPKHPVSENKSDGLPTQFELDDDAKNGVAGMEGEDAQVESESADDPNGLERDNSDDDDRQLQCQANHMKDQFSTDICQPIEQLSLHQESPRLLVPHSMTYVYGGYMWPWEDGSSPGSTPNTPSTR